MKSTACARSMGYLSAVAVVLTMLMSALPAEADSRTKSDPSGDAQSHLDVTSATYRNAARRVSVLLTVPDLKDTGTARLLIRPPRDGDGSLVAKLTKRADGSLQKRFFVGTVVGDDPARCKFAASWMARRSQVHISVPWKCITRLGGDYFGRGKLNLGAVTGHYKDYVTAASRIPRG